MARSLKTPFKSAPPKPPAKTPNPNTSTSKKAQAEADKPGRVEQVKQIWSMTRKQDPAAIPLVIGSALVVAAILVVLGIVLGHIIIFTIFAVLGAIIVGTSIFGRRATRSMYAQVEGKPGAAAAVLQGMRGDWRVTPAVGFTRNQELLHRVVGRPGVILIGEGTSTSAIRSLITDQKRRVGRVLPEIEIFDMIIGEGDDRIPISKLQTKLTKLPRNLKKSEVSGVEARLKALGGPSAPIPKGPMPTRMPRGKIR
jgi:Domain of unknown function (DUF4191)